MNERTEMRTEAIFEFVKYSIGSIAQFAPTEEIDWEEMYGFAKKQTIIGVLFMGIEKLPKERRPEKKLLMKWYAQTERIKQKNETINAEVVTVFDRFRKGTSTIDLEFYVTSPGNYSNGIATVQCAYAPAFAGHSAGSRIQVK